MNSAQAQFVAILKTKGTGPTMSKSLTEAEFPGLEALFLSPEVHLTTKATLLTALLTLAPTPEEAIWIQKIAKNPTQFLPKELCGLFPSSQRSTDWTPFLSLIHSVIQHQDLTPLQCSEAMHSLIDPAIPDYLKAAFLESERLKRETLEENKAFWNFLWQHATHNKAKVPHLIDLSNAYDGFNRTLYLTPFTAVLLAGAGFPTVMHGLDQISPKNGINPFKILTAAKKNPLNPIDKVIAEIENPAIGWGYIDQSLSCPTLYALQALRFAMVKRPFLATLEKLLQPLAGTQTYLVTSYTHPPYKLTLSELISSAKTWENSLIFRGVEGSIQLALDRRTPWITPHGTDFVRPEDYGLSDEVYEGPISVEASLEAGLAALHNQPGYARTAILYQSAVILEKLGLSQGIDMVQHLENTLDSGKALFAWNQGMR